MKAAKRRVEDDECDDADSAACGPAPPMQLTQHVVAGSRSNSGDDELGTPSKQSLCWL
jgi:hypothetical protein